MFGPVMKQLNRILGGHALNNSKFDCKNRTVLICSLALQGCDIVMDLFFIEAEKNVTGHSLHPPSSSFML